jgi:hypothetical protein
MNEKQPTPFKDWMGNKIHIGDTICRVIFQPKEVEVEHGIMFYGEDKSVNTQTYKSKIKQNPILLIDEGLVVERLDSFFVEIKDRNWTITERLAIYTDKTFYLNENFLIAIKGVSDKREDLEKTSLFKSFL